MNRMSLLSGLLILLFATIVFPQVEIPKRPVGAVDDRAALLTSETKSKLSLYSADIYKRTGIVVVFTSFETIHNSSSKKVVSDVYQKWGIGRKTGDKGILILATLNEQHLAFHTGKGVSEIINSHNLSSIKKNALNMYIYRDSWDNGILSVYSQFVQNFADYNNVEPFTFLAYNKKYNFKKSTVSNNKLIIFSLFSFVLITGLLFLILVGKKWRPPFNKFSLYDPFTDLFRCSLKTDGFGTYKRWMVNKFK